MLSLNRDNYFDLDINDLDINIETDNHLNDESEPFKENLSTEVQEILNKGDDGLSNLKKFADFFHYDSIISKELDSMKTLVIDVLDFVEKYPKNYDSVRKLVNHYLPIMNVALQKYEVLVSQTSFKGDAYFEARTNLVSTLKNTNSAFKKLLSDLYENSTIDLNADLSVLNNLYEKEGLNRKDTRYEQQYH